MQFDKLISKLLYENECVIIPGFGGFIANYRASRLGTDDGMIYPPSVELAFNPGLRNNDGLVANYISTAEKISYTEALVEIEQEVNKWNYILASGEAVFLKEIGELVLDDDDKIIFSPYYDVNYLPDSFGFKPLFINLVNRKKTVIHEQHFLQNTARKKSKSRQRNILVYSFTAYLPVLLLLWMYLFIKEPFKEQNLGSFDLFTTPAVSKIKAAKPGVLKEIKNEGLKQIYINDANSRSKGLQPMYYIVAGSFDSYQNALSLKKLLTSKKFKSEILDTGDGKYRVTYEMFEFGEEAVNYLHQIRKKENPAAWVIKQ